MSEEDNRTPTELRAEAARLDAQARELHREAAARERHAAGRRLCESATKSGRPCRNEARPGRAYCAHHDPDLTQEERQRLLSRFRVVRSPYRREMP